MNIRTCAIAALAIAMTVSPNAAVFTVTSPADSGPGSLRDAVAASSPGDTIQFAIKGAIPLMSAITIPHTLYVLGPGPSSLAIDAQHLDRAFVTGGNPVFISGLTIVNGLAAGPDGPDGSFGKNGGPGLDGLGGAILNDSNSDALYLSNCWFVGNTARGGHGGKGGDNPPATAFAPGNGGAGGQGLGGALYATGMVVIANCTFSGNRAIGGDGGAGGTNGSFALLAGGTGGNAGLSEGGAVDEPINGVFSFANATFSANSASGGNGGAGGDTLNGPGGDGGNSGNAVGGAVSTFIANFGSDTIISNSAIAGSPGAGGSGGPPGNAGSTSVAFGGGVTGYTLTCQSAFGNTIIADNYSSGIYSNYDIGFYDLGYNYLGTEDFVFCGGFAPGTQVGSDSSPLHPQLGPLAQNGGGMPTHAVLLTSPLLDAGNSFGLTNDERGAVRPYDFPLVPNAPGGDGSDIGAFELGSPDLGAAVSSNTVVISWPAAYGDFVLQSTTNLAGGWTLVTTSPVVVSNQFVVTTPTTNGSMFYRLLNQQ